MKIAHEDAARISAVDMALMLDLGWVRAWPFEMRPAAVRWIKQYGWTEAMRRATETAARLRTGEFEAVP